MSSSLLVLLLLLCSADRALPLIWASAAVALSKRLLYDLLRPIRELTRSRATYKVVPTRRWSNTAKTLANKKK